MKLNHWIVLAVDALATLGPLAAVLSDAGYGKASLVVGGIVSMAMTLTAMFAGLAVAGTTTSGAR